MLFLYSACKRQFSGAFFAFYHTFVMLFTVKRPPRNISSIFCRYYRQNKDKELFFMMNALDKFALTLVIIGAINWGLIGLFQFDLVAWLFGGAAMLISRIIYTLVGLGGIWSISLLFKDYEPGTASQAG